MEEGNAPFVARVVEGGIEPLDLLGIRRMIAVQHGKARVALVERVTILVAHVERLEMDFEIAVVIAERCVEFDAAIEQWLVRNQELVRVVVVVEIVAEHQHEREVPGGFEVREHRLGDLLLRHIARSAVAHDPKHPAAAQRRHR